MKVINVRNVNGALQEGLLYLYEYGEPEETRAGPVLVSPVPVTTVYSHPQERVLFSAARDANPFLHVMESLWLLAGRNDARWLDQFVKDFSARFAEPDGRLHGSYGFRWRKHFDLEGGGSPYLPDQLNTVVEMLRKNPQDRQAVITMWDPVADLGVPGLKDRPCNCSIFLRVREGNPYSYPLITDENSAQHEARLVNEGVPRVLDMQVNCRSNDLCWGLAGANAVHFSVLQEYLAARIGVGIGTYYQCSFNYHAYKNVLDQLEEKAILEEGEGQRGLGYLAEATPIVTAPECFDEELLTFLENPLADNRAYDNDFFPQVAHPMFRANHYWKAGDRQRALQSLALMPPRSDWRLAAYQWCQRRMSSKVSCLSG